MLQSTEAMAMAQDRNLEVGTEDQGWLLLTLVLCDMFILLCYTTQNHQGGPAHSELGPLISISNQKNAPITNHRPTYWRQFSFQGTWKFVAKLTKITSTNRWMRPKVKGFLLFVFYFIFSLLHTKFFKVVSTNKKFSQYISFWDAWKRRKSINLSYFTGRCYLLLSIYYAFSKMLNDI